MDNCVGDSQVKLDLIVTDHYFVPMGCGGHLGI